MHNTTTACQMSRDEIIYKPLPSEGDTVTRFHRREVWKSQGCLALVDEWLSVDGNVEYALTPQPNTYQDATMEEQAVSIVAEAVFLPRNISALHETKDLVRVITEDGVKEITLRQYSEDCVEMILPRLVRAAQDRARILSEATTHVHVVVNGTGQRAILSVSSDASDAPRIGETMTITVIAAAPSNAVASFTETMRRTLKVHEKCTVPLMDILLQMPDVETRTGRTHRELQRLKRVAGAYAMRTAMIETIFHMADDWIIRQQKLPGGRGGIKFSWDRLA